MSLESCLSALANAQVDSDEWNELWREAVPLAQSNEAAMHVIECLERARDVASVRGLLMILLNVRVPGWSPSPAALLAGGRHGDSPALAHAFALAIGGLAPAEALTEFLDAVARQAWSPDDEAKSLVLIVAQHPVLLADPRLLPMVRRAVTHARRDICEYMLDQLARANDRTSELDEAFAIGLADARPLLRAKAALALATAPVHAARAIDVLAELIADEKTSEAARCEAIEGLPPEIVSAPSIRAALETARRSSSSENVRDAAGEALDGVAE